MQSCSFLAYLALLSLAFASLASAKSEQSSFGLSSFIGLWEGIDPVDGGDSLRSITCFPDQSCRLAATDSIITLCDGGPGFVSGTGSFERATLVFPDAVLTCPDGRKVDLSIRLDLDWFNQTLVETTVVGGERTLPNITFHKISR
jgi:hypothetical protein